MSMEIVKQIRGQIAYHHMEIERLASALEVIEQVSGKALPVTKKDQPLFSVRRIAAAPASPQEKAVETKPTTGKGAKRVKSDKKINWKETVQNVLREHDEPLKSGEVIECLDIKRDDKLTRQAVYNALSHLTVNGVLTRDKDSYYHLAQREVTATEAKTADVIPATEQVAA